MALNVPHTGENIALEALVNKTAPQNLVLKLFRITSLLLTLIQQVRTLKQPSLDIPLPH